MRAPSALRALYKYSYEVTPCLFLEINCACRPLRALGVLLNCTLWRKVSRVVHVIYKKIYLLDIPVWAGNFAISAAVLVAVVSDSEAKFSLSAVQLVYS